MNKNEVAANQILLLLDYFQNLIPLSEAEKLLVSELFKPRLYRKRQYVLQEGDTCNHLNFIVTGCLRMYKVDGKGDIHIIQFGAENWWLSNIGSFHDREPSELNIDALEDTLVLQISHENLLILYKTAPKFDRIFRVLIEKSFVSLQKRLLQNISSTAEERYLTFIKNYPELCTRLPQTQIAAFLGISPEFLSRLRNKQNTPKS
jgi:CRP-like cAMP-binding protein